MQMMESSAASCVCLIKHMMLQTWHFCIEPELAVWMNGSAEIFPHDRAGRRGGREVAPLLRSSQLDSWQGWRTEMIGLLRKC